MNPSVRKLLVAGAGAAAAIAIAMPLTGPSGATTPGIDSTQLTAQLDGAQEVLPGDPNGVGEAFVFGAASSPDKLCYVLFVDRIRTAQAAHIHRGAQGVNGPVVVTLKTPASGNSAGCARTGLADNILANPQNFYVNVHNTPFPNGAVRGQLG